MGRIRLDAAGWPFIGSAFILALVSSAAGAPVLAIIFFVLCAFFVFFFRDPERRADAAAGDDAVLSPADGRVLVAGRAVTGAAPPGDWQQISIFLSAMDVHINRVPVSGRITRVSFTRGRFLPAYRHDAATANERSEIWIDHGGQTIIARQIVGVMARRVVCRLDAGADVRAGDRFGVMKFGSRMDVFVPPSATLSVSVGQTVRGGQTIIAVLH